MAHAAPAAPDHITSATFRANHVHQSQISPDDEIYAINGVPIAHQNSINTHEALAAKVKTLTARPLHVAFRKKA